MTQKSSKNPVLRFKQTKGNKLLMFTPKELKLLELLVDLDGSEKLARMLAGIVAVLSDKDNPVRFAQAANTIRCLTDEILNLKGQTKKPLRLLDSKKTSSLNKMFIKVLSVTLSKITDPKEKSETRQLATDRFKQLNKLLYYGARTKKQQLLALLYHKDSLKIIPKNLQDSAEKLTNIYNYFTDVLHEHRENEPDFLNKWVYFQDFLILVTSGFFDTAKEIDAFLEDGTINNERSK